MRLKTVLRHFWRATLDQWRHDWGANVWQKGRNLMQTVIEMYAKRHQKNAIKRLNTVNERSPARW